jgi:hypothetical protein
MLVFLTLTRSHKKLSCKYTPSDFKVLMLISVNYININISKTR